MNLSQKCQYAVRAVLELARRYGQGPVAISQIAASQAIPQRFLENILNEIKPTGLIASRRGIQGGYQLAKDPAEVTVGEIIRLIDGSDRNAPRRETVIGQGKPGPVSLRLRQAYLDIVRGNNPKYAKWLSPLD